MQQKYRLLSRVTKETRLLFSISCILMLAGCSGNSWLAPAESKPPSPEQLYEKAIHELEASRYDKATIYLEELELQYPASRLAADAKLKRIYAYYEEGKYEDAALTAEDFIRQYPAHPEVSYAYYLKAVSYYDQIVDISRDQKLTEQAINALQEVTRRFPDSKYAKDAKLKLDFAYNSLAGKEMEVGRFYLYNNQPIAAINRFKTVVTNYQTSIFIAEALYRLTEIYHHMGVDSEARKYAAVLGRNYPNDKWYKKAYNLLQEGSDSAKDDGKFGKIIKKIW